jgi:Zn-dependent protease/CBS domain-containing protein
MMFGTRWRLFNLLGIPIRVDASWLIILVLLTWTLINLFRETATDLPAAGYWFMGLGAALAFFACIVLHELGHALVARKVGIPIRGITLFLFGGVAEMESEPPSASSEFWMAVAGPAVSAALSVLFWLASSLVAAPVLVLPLQYLAAINLAVLVFNLVPAFPLDGGRVLRSILWGALGNLRRATYWAALSGRGFAWVLIGFGIMHFFAGNLFQGLWLGLIGLFLYNAAQGSYQQVLIRQALGGERVERFMNRKPIVVAPNLDLRRWVDDYVYRYHRKMFPVASNGHVEGIIGTQALAQFPRQEWDQHTVAEAMRPDADLLSIAPDADALEALAKMQQTGSSRLLVTDHHHLLGIVSLKDLLRFLNLKLELEDNDPDALASRNPKRGPHAELTSHPRRG